MVEAGAGEWQNFGADDPNFQRWLRDLARGAQSTADNYRRKVGVFLTWAEKKPAAFARLTSKQHHDYLTDYIDQEIGRGIARSTLGGVKKAVKSWLDWNDKPLRKRVKIPKSKGRGRARNATIPSGPTLKKILNAGDSRERSATGLMAYSGLRPEIMGNYDGTDGLRIGDFVDMAIEEGRVRFTKVPCRINIPESLSKTELPWFTFIGQEGCDYLQSYWEERANHKERLTKDSAAITPRKVAKPFMRSSNISDLIRGPIRKAAADCYPYLLRSYFATNLMTAESKGYILRDYRQFFMGHTGDIEHVYTLHKVLPPPVVEAMREAYEKSLAFLEANRTTQSSSDHLVDYTKLMLEMAGRTAQEIEALQMEGKSREELFDLMRTAAASAAPALPVASQRVVQGLDLDQALAEGWKFRATLPDGRSVVERP